MSTLADAAKAYALPADAPERERRLAFAHWLVADDNPLTPRVLVNRLWQHHFGTGIVATPSDFGYMGERPTHPELLDWLAAQLRAGGWRLKPLHKLIVMSQTYRQSSAYREEAAAIDARFTPAVAISAATAERRGNSRHDSVARRQARRAPGRSRLPAV